MIVLTGVNFADKKNMYKETKQSLIKFMGDFTERNDRTDFDVKLEPVWRRLTSSTKRTIHVQHGNTGWIKKKLNPLGSDGKILLCHSCGSYRHLVAECPNSWENMVKRKASKTYVEFRDQRDEEKLKGGEMCDVPVGNKQLVK